jgi:hypothetical protein
MAMDVNKSVIGVGGLQIILDYKRLGKNSLMEKYNKNNKL